MKMVFLSKNFIFSAKYIYKIYNIVEKGIKVKL